MSELYGVEFQIVLKYQRDKIIALEECDEDAGGSDGLTSSKSQLRKLSAIYFRYHYGL